MSDSIVFIHGAFLDSSSWERFAAFFAERGYVTLTPEWPRRAAALGVEDVVDHYAAILDDLGESPVLIGHSFGGLFAQILLGRGLGRAAVALDPVTPALAQPSEHHGVVELDFDRFNSAFTNTWPADAAREAYERYAVPDTAGLLVEDGLASLTMHGPAEVDFDREDRGPLLITVGEHDHTAPPAVAKSNFREYRRSEATTEFVEFPGRSHLLMAGDGWEEVAQYVADWLDRVLRPAAV